MIPINLKRFRKRHYPKFKPNSDATIILTNEELVGVFMFKVIGNVTVFRKGELFFYLNKTIGCYFSRRYYTSWDELKNCKPIKVLYVRQHDTR